MITYLRACAACLAALAVGTASAEVAGSAEAAAKLVPGLLGRMYTVVEPPAIRGQKAIVRASLLDLKCTLVLARHSTADPSGWVAERVECEKAEAVSATHAN